MPCICHGAISGDEELDDFLKSDKGKDVHLRLKTIAKELNDQRISAECWREEFNASWIKCFDHMLNGCDEK